MANANPRFIVSHSKRGNPSSRDPSGVAFQQGHAPEGIYKDFRASNHGIIGNDVASFPTTSDSIYIPHAAVVRGGPHVPRANPTHSIDETTYIPAWSVGDPR